MSFASHCFHSLPSCLELNPPPHLHPLLQGFLNTREIVPLLSMSVIPSDDCILKSMKFPTLFKGRRKYITWQPSNRDDINLFLGHLFFFFKEFLIRYSKWWKTLYETNAVWKQSRIYNHFQIANPIFPQTLEETVTLFIIQRMKSPFIFSGIY